MQQAFDEFKARHETDIAQMRKTNAGLQRERSDLQSLTDNLKAEMVQKARAAPNRFASPVTPSDSYPEEDDVFTGNSRRKQLDASALLSPDVDAFDTSPDPSPSKSSAPPTSQATNEVEALKQSLAHAHRQMASLKSSLQREKELKLEYRRKLATETGASMEWEDEDESTDASPSLSRSRNGLSRSHRQTPRGKSSGKFTLAQKLGMAAAERALEELGSPDHSSAYRESILDELDDEEPSPFIEPSHSRPTSVDGMDPAFANVLRPGTSAASLETDRDSPLKKAIVPRRARGGAYGSERPTSLVANAPSALSAELGEQLPMEDYTVMTDEELFDRTAYASEPPSKPLMAEMGIQCEPVDEPVVPLREFVDASTQCGPIEPPAPIETADVSVQFSPELAQVAAVAIQTDVEVLPASQSISIGTDPEVQPSRVDAAVSTLPSVMSEASVQTIKEPDPEPIPVPAMSSSVSTVVAPTPTPVPIPIIVEDETLLQPRLLPSTMDVAVPRASWYGRPTATTRPVAMLFDDESEAETETESEYVDARETEATPSSSVQDFQSFQTGDSSDAESVLTSIAVINRGLDAARLRHDSHATTRATWSPLSSQPPPPRVDTADAGMQTDPWSPPSPPPSLSNTISFQRAGASQPFQFIPPSPVKSSSSSLAMAASIVKSPVRDSGNVFLANGRARTSSLLSNSEARTDTDDVTSSSIMSIPSVVDRTRPPTMSLPPPPSMPPPATIPVKKASVPPRPTSPPPADLIQRATTPTFGRQGSLMVPQARAPRSSLGSQPAPPNRQTSSSSFRSAAAPHVRGIARSGPPPSTYVEPVEDKRQMSQTSLFSGFSGPRSRRLSVASSKSSDRGARIGTPQAPSNPMGSSTDPAVIQAITQTMIGEFLYKYTRKTIGKGHGDKRHKRFFWIHPYTKTLYWSDADPGATHVGESNAKSGKPSCFGFENSRI